MTWTGTLTRSWIGLLLIATIAPAADAPDREAVASAIGRMVLERGTPMDDVRNFVAPKIARMPDVDSPASWTQAAGRIRADVLDGVVFRGEAETWRDAETRVEDLGEIEGGPGYRIKKLRYEALPGFWIPALLYEPEELDGKAPVFLNVNGHDGAGKAAPYKQVRCINLAKRGIIALNAEWIGMGQLRTDGNKHGLINAIDLCGSGGIATHYLAMTRAIDLLLDHPNADPARVGVSGLSGGGWQTIFVSALDDRVTLTSPVAGYSSFLTRIEYLSDLGDSEQTPCDLATVADYTHLTALLAPRAALLTFNQKDNCCFAAPHAMPPLMKAAAPIYSLLDEEANLRVHVNLDPGTHNYEQDNRQALYRLIGDHWYADDPVYDPAEIPSADEVKTAEELNVPLPDDTLDLRSLALGLAESLPRTPEDLEERRSALKAIVRPIEGDVAMDAVSSIPGEGFEATTFRLELADAWSIPAVLLEPTGDEASAETVVLLADEGRGATVDAAVAHLAEGRRVVAVDPFYFGEAKPEQRDYLWALMIATVGERPLGVQVGGLLAAAGAFRSSESAPAPTVEAIGPRTGVVALVAAALEPEAIAGVTLHRPMTSLKQVIEEGRTVDQSPGLFCFGLLESFDLPQIEAMVAPRPVEKVKEE